jgi:Pretoxin HINT domain
LSPSIRHSSGQAPGHPFYLEVNVDASSRPAPQGHEDLVEPWVGAGDLKVGDKVRQADGTTGTVRIVKTEQKNQTMYNLDVANLDNFYVGEQGWLVHNGNCPTKALIRQFEDNFGIDSVYGLRRHGAGTTLDQQLWRAKTGYTPDGIQGSIRDATRFFDNADILEAYSSAVKSYRSGQQFVDIPFDRIVGEGYYAGGKVYGTSTVVRVQFSIDGKIVSGYPLLP